MQKKIHIQYYKNKSVEFILGSYDNKLCMLDYRYRKMRNSIDKRLQNGFNAIYTECNDDILTKTIIQLNEYFDMKRKEFDIPIVTMGTEFQNIVWNALLTIPYGTTSTYSQLAYDIGSKKAVRAVANANGANAIGIIIPCHRIIGSNGDLTGYAGGLS